MGINVLMSEQLDLLMYRFLSPGALKMESKSVSVRESLRKA